MNHQVVKIYGYEKDSDELLVLKEISLLCSIEELDKLICFLQTAKSEHNKVKNESPMCHSHFKDYDMTEESGQPDVIIVTKNE